jgi:hypothetical protein
MMDSGIRRRLLIVAVGALLFVILLWHPTTRQIIVFLLPLGSGYDDLLGLIGLIVGAIFLFSWLWTGIPTWLFRKRR